VFQSSLTIADVQENVIVLMVTLIFPDHTLIRIVILNPNPGGHKKGWIRAAGSHIGLPRRPKAKREPHQPWWDGSSNLSLRKS
jgi:hypothetical protein